MRMLQRWFVGAVAVVSTSSYANARMEDARQSADAGMWTRARRGAPVVRCAEHKSDDPISTEYELGPELQSMASPVYPDPARLTEQQGLVLCHAYVTSTGRVTRVHVFQGISAYLDSAAVAAARSAVFIPARGKDGAAVACWMVVPVGFHLPEPASNTALRAPGAGCRVGMVLVGAVGLIAGGMLAARIRRRRVPLGPAPQ